MKEVTEGSFLWPSSGPEKQYRSLCMYCGKFVRIATTAASSWRGPEMKDGICPECLSKQIRKDSKQGAV